MTKSEIFDRLSVNRVLCHRLGISDATIFACLEHWEEPHRFYHNLGHLSQLMIDIDAYSCGCDDITFLEELELISLFHDVIYNPKSKTNERDSAEFFINSVHIASRATTHCQRIYQAILDTDYSVWWKQPSSKVSEIFRNFDYNQLFHYSTKQLFDNGMKIFKEYQYVPYPTFVQARLEFIDKVIATYDIYNNFTHLNEYRIMLQSYRPRIGVYAGSFRPFHIGHLDVLEQAEKIFDKVIILSAWDPKKQFDQEWVDLLKETLPFHEIVVHKGLTTDYLKTVQQYANVTLVRGLRDGYDLNYEAKLRRFMEDIEGNVNVAYFLSNSRFQYISSSDLRDLRVFSQEQYLKYIPTKYSKVR